MKKNQPKKLAPAGETWREGVCLWRSSESWCSDDLLNLVHEWNKCDCKGLLIYSHCATLLMVITLCRWWLWAAHRDVALLTLHAVCWYITFWWEWQIDCWAQQKPFIKSKVEQLSPNCNHNSFTSHRLPGHMNMQPFQSVVLMWFVRARAVAVTENYLVPPDCNLIEFSLCILWYFLNHFFSRYLLCKWVH